VIGRQIAIAFGIAIVFPLLIFYGVSIFSPPPKFQDYNTVAPFNPNCSANAEKQKAAQKAFKDAESKFALRLFCVSAPRGYAAMLAEGFMAVSAVGTGLNFGGIFSVMIGYWHYWSFIADQERFVSLIVAAVTLLVIAHRSRSLGSLFERRVHGGGLE
jgi:hypothetical protein